MITIRLSTAPFVIVGIFYRFYIRKTGFFISITFQSLSFEKILMDFFLCGLSGFFFSFLFFFHFKKEKEKFFGPCLDVIRVPDNKRPETRGSGYV